MLAGECEKRKGNEFDKNFKAAVAAKLRNDADLIKELAVALRSCCEEVAGDKVPRCYACREDRDGHCMAAKRGCCTIYAAYLKATGRRNEVPGGVK